MTHKPLIALIAAVFLCAAFGTASAQSRGDRLRASGLQFDLPPDMRVASLDVHVAMDKIRLVYVFTTTTTHTVPLRFALTPLPTANNPDNQILLEDGQAQAGYTADTQPHNYQSLAIRVNGKDLPLSGRGRALLGARDVTPQLRAAGMPLLLIEAGIPPHPITANARKTLNAAGLYIDGDINWNYQAEYFWNQAFPPGDTRIEVRFSPESEYWDDFNWDLFSNQDPGATRVSAYCIDAAFQRAVRAAHSARYLELYSITHQLTSAGHWHGKVGRFHLTVDKGAPGNLVAFCPLAAKKISPTTFEWSAQDVVPSAVLDVLFINDPNASPPSE